MAVQQLISALTQMLIGLDGLVAVGAGIAVLTGLGAAIGIGLIVGKANDATARQPEASNKIRMNMLIGLAFAEVTALLGFVIGIMMITQG